MGRPKALLPLDGGDTFLTRIVRTLLAAGAADVVVVLGHGAQEIAATMSQSGLAARLAINVEYRTGQFSSVLEGLNIVDRPGVTGMLLTPVDAPLVSSDTVRAVMERHLATRAPIVRPVRGEEHGHPVLIDRSLFAALRAADPSTGAKPVVRGHVTSAGDVVVDDDGAFLDVDTPEEYARLLQQLAAR